jgi:hypothetical protein
MTHTRKRIFIVSTFLSYSVFIAAAIIELLNDQTLSWPIITALLAMAGKDAVNYSFSRTEVANSPEYKENK